MIIKGTGLPIVVVLVVGAVFMSVFDDKKSSSSSSSSQLVTTRKHVRWSQNNPGIQNNNPYVPKLADDLSTITHRMKDALEPSHYQAMLEQAKTNETWQLKWNAFEPLKAMTSCQPPERECIGGPCSSDQSKITCGLSALQPGCVVYSIGSSNRWHFEEEMLEKTPCIVHTFDCTGDRSRFQPPARDRLHFHYVCIGTSHEESSAIEQDSSSTDSSGRKRKKKKNRYPKLGPTWTLSEMQRNLGHSHVDLYKMDIEGFEWPLIESWSNITATSVEGTELALPTQLLVEVHWHSQFAELWPPGLRETGQRWKTPAQIVELSQKLLRMGYVVVERDDNPRCPHCTELTLVRVHSSTTGTFEGY